jgi:hypothetical protein
MPSFMHERAPTNDGRQDLPYVEKGEHLTRGALETRGRIFEMLGKNRENLTTMASRLDVSVMTVVGHVTALTRIGVARETGGIGHWKSYELVPPQATPGEPETDAADVGETVRPIEEKDEGPVEAKEHEPDVQDEGKADEDDGNDENEKESNEEDGPSNVGANGAPSVEQLKGKIGDIARWFIGRRASVTDAERGTGFGKPTVKKYVAKLVTMGILRSIQKGKRFLYERTEESMVETPNDGTSTPTAPVPPGPATGAGPASYANPWKTDADYTYEQRPIVVYHTDALAYSRKTIRESLSVGGAVKPREAVRALLEKTPPEIVKDLEGILARLREALERNLARVEADHGLTPKMLALWRKHLAGPPVDGDERDEWRRNEKELLGSSRKGPVTVANILREIDAFNARHYEELRAAHGLEKTTIIGWTLLLQRHPDALQEYLAWQAEERGAANGEKEALLKRLPVLGKIDGASAPLLRATPPRRKASRGGSHKGPRK